VPILKDKLPGGLADSENLNQYCKKQLLKGLLVELEHTDDIATALEITTDHLEEDNKYYDHLEDMENKMNKPIKELSKDAWKRIAGVEESVEEPGKKAQKGLPNNEEAYDRLGGVIDLIEEWYETEESIASNRLDTVLESLVSIQDLITPNKLARKAQEGYQGWTNHPTWAVALHLSNDRGMYDMVQEMKADSGGDWMALADMIQGFIEELQPELEGPFSEMLNSAMASVNWDEIAQSEMEE